MTSLKIRLGKMFLPSDASVARVANTNERRAYAAFRRECQRRGLTYRMTRDGYIEFSNGTAIPHYNYWAESLSRLTSQQED